MKRLITSLVMLFSLSLPSISSASVQLCNRSDVTVLVAVALESKSGMIATQGWWKIYPGLCGEPVSTNDHQGRYFIHSRAHPLLTDVGDGFVWGEQQALCVSEGDFDINDVNNCPEDAFLAGFNEYLGSWKNNNIINILNPERTYSDGATVRIAGVQKMLTLLGYPISEVSGKMDQVTSSVLKDLAKKHQLDTSSYQALFIKLDELIVSDLK